MKRVITIVVLLLLAAGVYGYVYPRLSGVSAADAQQAAPAGAAKAAAAGGQRPGGGRPGGPGGFPTGVVTAVAQQQTIPITKSAVGYVEPANTVVVRSRLDGTLVAVDAEEGKTVKVGDVLFKLDDRALQATIAKDQAQIAKDQANADSAQAALKREQDLVKRGVDSQSVLDAATAAAKAAQATVTVDQATLQGDQVSLSYTTITAPMAGRLGTVNTSVGNVVHASDTSAGGLVTITQMSPLRVSFSISEADLDAFRAAFAKTGGLPVSVAAPGDKAPRASGTLSFIDSSVDTTSGTIVLKADIDNTASKLWPGQYVTATTQLGAYANATTVPLVAVQQSDSGPYVFVVGANHKVKKQPVTVVASVGETAVVGPELKPGDHVVVEGQLRLADGATVRETPQGQATNVAANGGAPAGGGTRQPRRAANTGGASGGTSGGAASTRGNAAGNS